jgi:hypothetical protein
VVSLVPQQGEGGRDGEKLGKDGILTPHPEEGEGQLHHLLGAEVQAPLLVPTDTVKRGLPCEPVG